MTASSPEPVGSIITELVARLGLAQQRGATERLDAWREAVGEPFASATRIGSVQKGKLEVIVANSTMMQELNFDKTQILARLNAAMPELSVGDLRFRIGPVGEEPMEV